MEGLRLKVGHHISLDSGSKHLLPTYVLKNSNFPSQNFCDKKVCQKREPGKAVTFLVSWDVIAIVTKT